MSDNQIQDSNIGKLWGTFREFKATTVGDIKSLTRDLYGPTGSNGMAGRLKMLEEKVEYIEKELPETLGSIKQAVHEDYSRLNAQISKWMYEDVPRLYAKESDLIEQREKCEIYRKELDEKTLQEKKDAEEKKHSSVEIKLLMAGVVVTAILGIFDLVKGFL